MSPDLHRRASTVFGRACEIPEAERSRFLDSACEGDAELRTYVEALLADDREAPHSFLNRPAIYAAAKLLQGNPRRGLARVLIGASLGNYEIEKQIGSGGMGTVFRARDVRLNRAVAVKVLTSDFNDESDRIHRFQQEARAASLLNHPNIVSIYDADQDQGVYYIAAELVEGRTLRQLAEEGPVPIRQLMDIASQTASALAAAHEAGIVHRDVKPENIMVRDDGFVKVLDFGLAKLTEHPRSQPPDFSTRPGWIAGTVHYLSPEQAMGKPVGPCSDLFSFGVVLYELATGVRPFTGPTDAAVFDAILRHTPAPVSQLRPEVDSELEALIHRLLEKEPEFRFQTAADLRSTLKRLTRDSRSGISGSAAVAITEPDPGPRAKNSSSKLDWRVVFATAAVVLAFVAALALWRQQQAALRSTAVPSRFERLTTAAGEERFPNLSPDGSQFFYAGESSGKWDIYLQRTGGSTVVNLTAESNEDDTQPALSPDGSRIAFRSERNGGGLFVMEATGENPRRVSSRGYLPAWSPDGSQLVYSTVTFGTPTARGEPVGRLVILNLNTGAERELETGADAIQPNWSPHGNRIAYWGLNAGGRRDIFTISATATPARVVRVTDDASVDWSPVWSRDGRFLYFLSDRGGVMNLWRVAIDEPSGEVRGKPEAVTMPTPEMSFFSFSADGRGIIFSTAERGSHLFSIRWDAARRSVVGTPERVVDRTHHMANFSFSPDGSQIVYDTVGGPQEDIWVMDRDGSGQRRLQADPAKDRAPAWSPNGDEIAFLSDRSGRYEVWAVRADGSGLRQVTQTTGRGLQGPTWSGDGNRIYSSRQNGVGVVFPAHASTPVREPEVLPGIGASDTLVILEPPGGRGRLLIGEPGTDILRLYEPGNQAAEVLPFRGMYPVWSPDGSAIVYGRGGQCLLYDLHTRVERQLFDESPGRIYRVEFSRDRIFFTSNVRNGDIWIGRMDLR